MRVLDVENVPLTGPLIVACNHVSYLDPPALGAAMPRPVTYMAKQELFRILGIFPEGTRNKDGTVQPQQGVALLHYLSGAPILPVYLDGTGHAERLGRVSAVFGRPVSFTTGEKASREEMAKWTTEIMQRVFALKERLRAD